MGGWNFTEDEEKNFTELPEGEYMLVVAEANPPKESEKTKGLWSTQLVLNVAKGPHEGAKVWHNLILSHPDPDKNKICRGIAKSFVLAATGKAELRDERDLSGKSVLAKVKPETYDGKTYPKISSVDSVVGTGTPLGKSDGVPF